VSGLSGARVVVTGGAGTIGSHVVDAALAAGAAEVIAIDMLLRGDRDNIAAALATGRARLVEVDIRNRDAVRANIEGADLVFHQAALRWTRCQENPRECQEVMVDGTFNVIEAASEAKVRRVVLASSAVVYGDPIRLPYDEDHPVGGTRVYGAAKVANEQMARAFAHATGLPTTILRYFNVYGPRQDIRSPYVEVMVKWLDLIDQGKPLVLFGDGSASVDFIFVGDVARANLLACDTKTIDDVVNICSGIETRMSDLAAILLDITGSNVGLEHRPQPAGALPARRYGDPRRAKELLGFSASTDLRDGVKKLIAWRRESLAAKPKQTA